MASDSVPIHLVREIVKATLDQAGLRSRAPRLLVGTVEDVDPETQDVAYVRLDNEAMSSDPTQSDNWGAPGVIYTTPLGTATVNEQVRVEFDPQAGANVYRTGLAQVVGQVYVDATQGIIQFVANEELVGHLSANQWMIGKPGAQSLLFDPVSGLKVYDGDDSLRLQLSGADGLVIRRRVYGITSAALSEDGLVVSDPVTGDRISITSGATSGTPTPHWAGLVVPPEGLGTPTPGSSHSTPAIASFGTGDDFDLRFVAASQRGEIGAPTYTAPSGWTEQVDNVVASDGVTLAASVATRDPSEASPSVAAFTNTASTWDAQVGHTVVIRGGGATSPAVRSTATATMYATELSYDIDVPIPSGAPEGDMVVAFVAVVSDWIPTGWTTPQNWKPLGIKVAGTTSPGPGEHILSSGAWYKRAGASEPASETVRIVMHPSSSFARVRVVTVAVSNPYSYPSGLDIRLNNRSMPRGLIAEAASTTATGAISNSSMPVTVDSLTDVPLKVGRSYRISYTVPNYVLSALNSADTVGVSIEIDEGAGFTSYVRTQRRVGAAGVSKGEIGISRVYVPASDMLLDVRTRLRADAVTTGFTMSLEGATDHRRSLAVDDIGAIY